MLLALGENRHHADTVQASATEDTQVLRARVIQLERRADSSAVRVRYLERQAVRLMRAGPQRGTIAEGPPFGPGWAPAEQGHLVASVGKVLHKLFFWLGPSD